MNKKVTFKGKKQSNYDKIKDYVKLAPTDVSLAGLEKKYFRTISNFKAKIGIDDSQI